MVHFINSLRDSFRLQLYANKAVPIRYQVLIKCNIRCLTIIWSIVLDFWEKNFNSRPIHWNPTVATG